jgi:DNA-binding NtrC family response regulator
MRPNERGTAEHAAPDAEGLCASVFLRRAFMVELPLAGEVTIGRDADTDMQLGDGSVSRRHASLEMRQGHAILTDLASRNGTFVNGERLGHEPRRVTRGDEIALGAARVALVARAMVPSGVRAVLVRSALIDRLDADLARGADLEALALRSPQPWYETDGVAAWHAALPADVYVGLLGESALLVAGPAGAMARVHAGADLDAQSGTARASELGARSARELSTAALRALGAHRAPPRGKSAPVAIDAGMRKVYADAAKIAPSAVGVLLIGETGVGKEVLARFVHEHSGRQGRLVSVNTAALPEALVESELFGHERGAFSGAHQPKVGLIESANGGTLFLDEIGDLPGALQAKLLRVLEERSVRRVGSTQERKVDVRILAATHRDLERAVDEGAFRRDLLFRLNACTLLIPPLRERVDEIDALARTFADEASPRGAKKLAISREALEQLRGYAWPGNVRELRNVIERGVALAAGGDEISIEHLPEGLRRATSSPKPASVVGDVRDDMKDYERRRIVDALAQSSGNQSAAAKLLGLPRRTLAYKMARLAIRNTPE